MKNVASASQRSAAFPLARTAWFMCGARGYSFILKVWEEPMRPVFCIREGSSGKGMFKGNPEKVSSRASGFRARTRVLERRVRALNIFASHRGCSHRKACFPPLSLDINTLQREKVHSDGKEGSSLVEPGFGAVHDIRYAVNSQFLCLVPGSKCMLCF